MATCQYCATNIQDYLTIIKGSTLAPTEAISGSIVTITGVVTTTCSILICPLGGTAKICLYDRNTSELYDSKEFNVGNGQQVVFSLAFTMPDNNVNLRLSLGGVNIIFGFMCQDYQDISIHKIVPGATYSCNSSTKTCYEDSNSKLTWNQCYTACVGGGGGACDPAKDMNIMGTCVPKQVVFFGFVLAAIYMFKD